MDPFGQCCCILILTLLFLILKAEQNALLKLIESELEEKRSEGDLWADRFLRQLNARIPVADKGRTLSMLFTVVISMLCAHWWMPGLTASFQASMSETMARILSFFVLALIVCAVLLLLIEQIGRLGGRKNPEKTAKAFYSVWVVFSGLFAPLTLLTMTVGSVLLRIFRLQLETPDVASENEIRQLVDESEEKGIIESDEKEMIENVFEFNDLTAKDIMLHRTDVVALSVNTPAPEILKTIEETGLSRFPVYEEDIDSIIGILNTRDYLLEQTRKNPRPIRRILRKAYFVPSSVRADVLFKDMQAKKVHLSVVVDEYGGTSGIITMEDLLEEIVGNIYDEFDPLDEQELVALGNNSWRVSGSIDLETLGDVLDMNLEDEDDSFDTLGGLIFSQLSEIPEDGSHPEIKYRNLRIRVESIDDHRVDWAIVRKEVPDPEESEDPANE